MKNKKPDDFKINKIISMARFFQASIKK